jgi:hypothetical protein
MKHHPINSLPSTKGETTNQPLDTFTFVDSTEADSLDIIAKYLLKAIQVKASNQNQKESA